MSYHLSVPEPGGLRRVRHLASNLSGLAPMSDDIFTSPVLHGKGFTARPKASLTPVHLLLLRNPTGPGQNQLASRVSRAIASGKCRGRDNSLDSMNTEKKGSLLELSPSLNH